MGFLTWLTCSHDWSGWVSTEKQCRKIRTCTVEGCGATQRKWEHTWVGTRTIERVSFSVGQTTEERKVCLYCD